MWVTDNVFGGAGARLVDIALDEGSIFTSDGWKHIESTFENGTVHFIGLASDGGVHSRLDQVRPRMIGENQGRYTYSYIGLYTCQRRASSVCKRSRISSVLHVHMYPVVMVELSVKFFSPVQFAQFRVDPAYHACKRTRPCISPASARAGHWRRQQCRSRYGIYV